MEKFEIGATYDNGLGDHYTLLFVGDELAIGRFHGNAAILPCEMSFKIEDVLRWHKKIERVKEVQE